MRPMHDRSPAIVAVAVAIVGPALACLAILLFTPGVEKRLLTAALEVFGVLGFIAAAIVELIHIAGQPDKARQADRPH
jgi:hypothetical protein